LTLLFVPTQTTLGAKDKVDLPRGRAASSSESSSIEIDCRLVTPVEQPVRAICKFTQTSLLQQAAPGQKEKDELDKAIRSIDKARLSKECAGLLPVQSHAARPERDLRDRVEDACAKKDPLLYANAARAYFREISGKVCKLETTSFEFDFTRQDANTWIHTSGPEGMCNVSLSISLWRKGKDSGPFWNFQQTRAVPPNGSGHCESLGRLQTKIEFRWDNSRLRDLTCSFLEM
jgi:hypothetical protein